MANSQIHKKGEKVYKLSDRVTTPSLDMSIKYREDKSSQFTSLFIRTYASTEEVERLVEVLNPDEYAYIVHDKDKQPNGELKEKHIHLLMYKRTPMRLTKIMTFSEANTRVEVPRSKKYAYEYLTHKNDPDKTSYSKEDIHEYHKSNNTFETTLQEQREERTLEMLDDIGNLPRREMARKYGTDYIKNYQRYESFLDVVREDEQRDEAERLVKELNESARIDDYVDLKIDNALLACTYREHLVRFLTDNLVGNGGEFPTYRDFCRSYYELLQLWSSALKVVMSTENGGKF